MLHVHFANAKLRSKMRTDTPTTPLLALLRELRKPDRREEFAALTGTSIGYLYQLAGCYPNRKACRSDLALRIEQASRALNRKYRTPVVTMQQLATMCADGKCGAKRGIKA